jgi:hypothetical protein
MLGLTATDWLPTGWFSVAETAIGICLPITSMATPNSNARINFAPRNFSRIKHSKHMMIVGDLSRRQI